MKALEGSMPERPSSDRLQAIASQISAERQLSDEERHRLLLERLRARADEYNRTPGKLKDGYYTSTIKSDQTFIEGDGYDCKECMNRGDRMELLDTGKGLYECSIPCKCMEIRRSIWRMRASGLEKSVREKTFKTFAAREPWQQKMLGLARKFLAEGAREGRWLFLGGQVGCGKTHICTAVAGRLLLERPVMYVVWPQVSKKIKALSMEAEEYESEVSRLQRIEVLFIDDYFKPATNNEGAKLPPTAADIKLAFEILNYRYINKLPTILSSEWHLAELADMDEATASRIAERCGEYAMAIGRDRKRNQRYVGGMTV